MSSRFPTGTETQPLLHDVHADEERRGDVLFGPALIAQGQEGAELIERMQRRALDVLGQRVSSPEMSTLGSRTMHGTGAVLARRFCLTSSWSARQRRPPAGISNMPVSTPSASRTGRTLRPCRSVRRAMSSASSSIETPAFTRRTFDCYRMSLLKEMSRDDDRVIF